MSDVAEGNILQEKDSHADLSANSSIMIVYEKFLF